MAGKRLGPAEVESLLVADDRVVEAAAIGVPDDVKGEALVCFVVLHAGQDAGAAAPALRDVVTAALGKAMAPQRRSTSSRRCPRPATARSCGGWPGPPTSARPPATSTSIEDAPVLERWPRADSARVG